MVSKNYVVGHCCQCRRRCPRFVFAQHYSGITQDRGGATPIWVSFAANLLILLSLFYIPIDPVSYRVNAALAVFARWAGVVFFTVAVFVLNQSQAYLILCLIDLVFGLPLTILLLRFRHQTAFRAFSPT